VAVSYQALVAEGLSLEFQTLLEVLGSRVCRVRMHRLEHPERRPPLEVACWKAPLEEAVATVVPIALASTQVI
jgi:hypothetical protein